jgi:hypothetical protein
VPLIRRRLARCERWICFRLRLLLLWRFFLRLLLGLRLGSRGRLYWRRYRWLRLAWFRVRRNRYAWAALFIPTLFRPFRNSGRSWA